MLETLLDESAADQAVKDCELRVGAAQAAWQNAQNDLSRARQRQALAKCLAGIVRQADVKVSVIIAAHTRAQQARLLEAYGNNTSKWKDFDPSTFQDEPIRQWLEGKTIIDTSTLNGMFGTFKSEAGELLPDELRGTNRLREFAELVKSRMFMDDEWPPIVVTDGDKVIAPEFTIAFDTPALR